MSYQESEHLSFTFYSLIADDISEIYEGVGSSCWCSCNEYIDSCRHAMPDRFWKSSLSWASSAPPDCWRGEIIDIFYLYKSLCSFPLINLPIYKRPWVAKRSQLVTTLDLANRDDRTAVRMDEIILPTSPTWFQKVFHSLKIWTRCSSALTSFWKESSLSKLKHESGERGASSVPA